MPTNRRISQADVARIAGVSTNTVSRVVRGDPEVADATRRRISALLAEVDYRPNFAARSLATNKTGVLHVALAAPMFHGHGRTLLSVLNAAALAGFNVSMSNTWNAEGNTQRDIAPFDVDGIVILGGQEPTIDLALRAATKVPTVLLLGSEHDLDGVSTVAVDNVRGSYLASSHLLRMGITDLAHLGGPGSWGDSGKRQKGFEQACREFGVKAPVFPADSWNARDGYDAVRSLPRLPAGLVCANDQLAMGAMRAIAESGALIPGDVRVVGFDDMDGADCFQPPLTTIRQPFDRVGRTAVRLIRQMLDGIEAQDILIEPELVIRASSSH
ncbi:LacI family DNA-binding transcriptional regulator [Schaalia suimastitidis]|uniref:LacI family DNA-binding transcriptional regulator n=1 Tax=Schaalia suimastitidis TaxID=121163 RepID=UPI0005544DF5|nr:LacI family DNA-binding transcriptional regulator [Schaalia suimastitidis]